jgi:hypothetical protein
MRFEPATSFPDFSQYEVGVYFSYYNGTDAYSKDDDTRWPESGKWNDINSSFGYVGVHEVVDIVVHISFSTPARWKGTLYLDDIRIY